MSRLAQLGVFSVVLGGVVFFLGLFPSAVDADTTPGVGLTQIAGILTGMTLLILGAYVIVYALVHRTRGRSLLRDVGVRLGMTGLVFAYGATLADVLGFGTHIEDVDLFFGWLQGIGLMGGFLIAAIGVFVYGMVASPGSDSVSIGADQEGQVPT